MYTHTNIKPDRSFVFIHTPIHTTLYLSNIIYSNHSVLFSRGSLIWIVVIIFSRRRSTGRRAGARATGGARPPRRSRAVAADTSATRSTASARSRRSWPGVRHWTISWWSSATTATLSKNVSYRHPLLLFCFTYRFFKGNALSVQLCVIVFAQGI